MADSKYKPAVLWFTGLSGSGKSTIAEKLVADLRASGQELEYLDGDAVREIFPKTGFTKEERDSHIKRIGFIASLLEKHGVLVVASFVSPYASVRNEVRELCNNFVEVYISTSVEECERRDVKGLYAKARRGEIKNFTGVSDPYEVPRSPEIEIATMDLTPDEACEKILAYLKELRV